MLTALLLAVVPAQGVPMVSPAGIPRSGGIVDGVLVGPQRAGTTDPTGMLLRPGACYGGDATCTAAPLVIAGGQDTSTVTIDDFAQCSGATTTFTVCTNAGTCSDTVLTEGTDWDAETDDATSAANFAAATVSGVTLTAAAEVVYVGLAATTASVTLARDTAACNSVSVGTAGGVVLGRDGTATVPSIGFASDPDTGVYRFGSNQLGVAGALYLRNLASGVMLSVGTAGTQFFAVQNDQPRVSVTSTSQLGLGAVTFAGLGTPSNGVIVYCSDCTKATPCAGAGSGALAKRINGAWDCD